MHRLKGILLVLLALCLPVAPVYAGEAPDEAANTRFTRGVQAFRAGDYELALHEFESAEKLGLDTWSLHFNQAVTCYHLGRYAQARARFEKLLATDANAERVRYNLGLVALRQGFDDEAYDHFLRVAGSTDDPALRKLAETQLAAFVPVSRNPGRVHGFVDAGGGYDDNVALVPDPAVIVSTGEEDTFTELMGGMVARLNGTAQRGLRLKASAYWIDYSDLDAFDQVTLRGGLAWRAPYDVWRTETSGYIDLVYLDDELFERLGSLSLQGTRDVGETASLRLRASTAYIDAEGDFSALTGWRHQLLGELRDDLGNFDWRLGYEFELNDRDDRSTATESVSVSPQQHTLFARGDWQPGKDVTLFAGGEYRYSRYRDSNRIMSGGKSVTETREDRTWRASAGIDWHLSKSWMITGEYRYSRNDSNLDDYDYTSNRFMAHLEYLF
jgi:opacity protein-like surface antigen